MGEVDLVSVELDLVSFRLELVSSRMYLASFGEELTPGPVDLLSVFGKLGLSTKGLVCDTDRSGGISSSHHDGGSFRIDL